MLSRKCFSSLPNSLVYCHACASNYSTTLWFFAVTQVFQSASQFFGCSLSRECFRALYNSGCLLSFKCFWTFHISLVSECFNILLKSTFRPETLKRDKYVVITQDNNLITSLWTVWVAPSATVARLTLVTKVPNLLTLLSEPSIKTKFQVRTKECRPTAECSKSTHFPPLLLLVAISVIRASTLSIISREYKPDWRAFRQKQTSIITLINSLKDTVMVSLHDFQLPPLERVSKNKAQEITPTFCYKRKRKPSYRNK